MKNILLLLITILISACSSTKQVTEIALNKPIEKVVVINDSIFENNKSTIVYKETSQDSLKRKPEFVSKHANRGLVKETIEIHELWNELLQEHVSDKGNVDYQGLIKERLKLNNYIKLLNPELPNGTHKKEYTLAFWINAYNAMTVDLILRHYPVKSIKDIKDPWQQRYCKLGEKLFNLEDIEHQILRKMEAPRFQLLKPVRPMFVMTLTTLRVAVICIYYYLHYQPMIMSKCTPKHLIPLQIRSAWVPLPYFWKKWHLREPYFPELLFGLSQAPISMRLTHRPCNGPKR